MREILVGTSGWSYDDWVGPFYPKGAEQSRWLEHYAHRFPTVEVNFTHYQEPAQEQIRSLTSRMVDAGLREVVYKTPRIITHEALPDGDLLDARERAASFFTALEPAADADLLGGVLVQFSHRAGPEVVLDGIEALQAVGSPAPLFVEVRHAGFNEDRHHEALADLVEPAGGAVVATDSPASTITRAPPAEHAYFRFHGRNEQTWFDKDPSGIHGSARYDYLYPEAELEALAGRIEAAEAEHVLVYFNNHVGGQAPRNATQLMDLLGIDPPEERVTLDDF